MLQRAAAADAEMRAARHHAFRGGLEHGEQLGFVVLAMVATADETHGLAGQRAADESGLAAAHDALAFVVQ